MKRLIYLYLLVILAPVSLGGDWILPFFMAGSANGQDLSYVLTTTSGSARPFNGATCSSTFRHRNASGTITYGGETYRITGACKLGNNRYEILGSNASKTIVLRNGTLNARGHDKVFSGTLSQGRIDSNREVAISPFELQD